jgi:hypothetical protein
MEVNMNRTLTILASTAMVSLALAASHAAEVPLPPRVNYIATLASQLPQDNETFVAFTFVDGVMTEFENLGRMPDDTSFQGR